VPAARRSQPKLTVAVTGPTGELGRSLVSALESAPAVGKIVGMARRPFDPGVQGWRKTVYRRGDVLDRAAVDALVEDADAVVHLAFLILGGPDDTREINLRGSRNVFEASLAAGVQRLVYASSVAAYGFHSDNPSVLTEDVPVRGSDDFYYSAQKAELEAVLDELLEGSATDAYVFRPCIVAGPDARMLVRSLPYVRLSEQLPAAVRALFDVVPVLKPVLPDPGVPFQLVHHDDVATALRAGVLGRGSPGVYNLAAPGELTVSDLAEALGWYSVPLPELALDATAEVLVRLPFLPPEAAWISALRQPMIMDAGKARRELRWRPRHDADDTLRQMIAAHREDLEA
jgi:nucleoside-diphosphate-sugar epimerase